jgi:anti-sigma B factor antagonist
MNLKIQHETSQGTHYLKLVGEVHSYTVSKLKEVLEPLSEQKEQAIVIDLQQIDFIDSIGVKVFQGALKSTNKNHNTLLIKGMSYRVRQLFKVTGLLDLMEFCNQTNGEEKSLA